MTTYDMVEPPDLMYGVLLNDVDDDALERSDSFGGWTLKRAPLDAMVSLRVEFKKYSSAFEPDFPGSHECQIVPSGQGFHFSPIADCARWRYGVLIPGEGRLLNGAKLSEALRISDSDLHVDLWQLNPRDWNSGLGGSPAHCITALRRFKRSSMPEAISVSHVQEIVDLRSTLDESQFAGIARSLALFRELDALFETDFKLLGYFAVLESLLSHAPTPSDTVDSITRQLKRNLSLLDNRLRIRNESFGLDGFLQSATPAQVMSKLYSLRSAIAHGDNPEDVRQWLEGRRPAEFEGWPPHLWINRFVRSLTQKALQCALREPQLVSDLKGLK